MEKTASKLSPLLEQIEKEGTAMRQAKLNEGQNRSPKVDELASR
jgi:hypothetical protein